MGENRSIYIKDMKAWAEIVSEAQKLDRSVGWYLVDCHRQAEEIRREVEEANRQVEEEFNRLVPPMDTIGPLLPREFDVPDGWSGDSKQGQAGKVENETNKIETLLARCKCGVFLSVNEHRDCYQTVQQRFEELNCRECPPDIADDIKRQMIETDTVVELHFYPETPIGFYEIFHYDLNLALDAALGCLSLPESAGKKRSPEQMTGKEKT